MTSDHQNSIMEIMSNRINILYAKKLETLNFRSLVK